LASSSLDELMDDPMPQVDDLSRSFVSFDQTTSLTVA
jgi:hypothetical protein